MAKEEGQIMMGKIEEIGHIQRLSISFRNGTTHFFMSVVLLLMVAVNALADSLHSSGNTPLLVKHDVKVIIDTDKSQYASGDPILVHVVIQNFGTVAVTHFTRRFVSPTGLMVVRTLSDLTTRDTDGPVRMTNYGQFITDRGNIIISRMFVPPGEQHSYYFLLNQSRDITMPGTYTITMVYTIFPNDDDDKSYLVTSNTTNFSVTFDPPQVLVEMNSKSSISKIESTSAGK